MKVLVVGAGGREHALAWKIGRSRLVEDVAVLPGNAGIEALGIPCLPGDLADVAGIVASARRFGAGLVVVGPEAPLALGLADALDVAGVAVFGPGRLAAEIETTKAWAKRFMRRHGIPTAEGEVFDELEPAIRYVRRRGGPLVVKADGLAAGKGAVVAETVAAAEAALQDMLVHGRFGEAGRRVVVEERLFGEELSLFAVCDGEAALVLPPARDAKRLLAGDRGPNTGGMGAYAPVPGIGPELAWRLAEAVILPAIRGLREEGRPFRGVLYAGLMLTPAGPRVLEYNARFGDPEAQALLPIYPGDLTELLLAASRGELGPSRLGPPGSGAAVCVVLAAPGYPEAPALGVELSPPGPEARLPHTLVFSAGVGPGWRTAGGRVWNAVGLGETLADARLRAYRLAEALRFPGSHYREDVALIGAAGHPASGPPPG
ncbi:MAG: phosphoribosylamine--glycine ligase [Clostridia bacterium]|nr:phosphoribosylamine--glycine ligase [Clostridia bacterium]